MTRHRRIGRRLSLSSAPSSTVSRTQDESKKKGNESHEQKSFSSEGKMRPQKLETAERNISPHWKLTLMTFVSTGLLWIVVFSNDSQRFRYRTALQIRMSECLHLSIWKWRRTVLNVRKRGENGTFDKIMCEGNEISSYSINWRGWKWYSSLDFPILKLLLPVFHLSHTQLSRILIVSVAFISLPVWTLKFISSQPEKTDKTR